MKKNEIMAIALTAGMLLSAVTACTPGNDPVESSAQNTTVVTTESEASSEATTEASTEASSESSEDTKATESSEDTKATESSEDTKATESSEDTKPTEKPSDNKGGIENQKYCNTFLTNFVEQGFNATAAGQFDVQNAKVEDLLRFVYMHLKINSYKTLEPGQKGECTYSTFTYEKAVEVIGKYMSYLLHEEDCKNLPAPPETFEGGQFGPYYADGKIWFVSGDGESYTSIAIADSVTFSEDGTATLNFTVYEINLDVYQSLDSEGIKKYYELTPAQAASDKSLTKRGTGVAKVDIGQSGKYTLKTYEVSLG